MQITDKSGKKKQKWLCLFKIKNKKINKRKRIFISKSCGCVTLVFVLWWFVCGSQSGLIPYGFFQHKRFTYKSRKVTKRPKHGSRTLAHLQGLLGRRKCHLRSCFCIKKSYKIPSKIHTRHRSLGEHRRHISPLRKWSGELIWCLEAHCPVLEDLSPAGGLPGKERVWLGLPSYPGHVTAISLFGTLDLLNLLSKSRSFSMKQS